MNNICNNCKNKHCSWKHWMYNIARRTRRAWSMAKCVSFEGK